MNSAKTVIFFIWSLVQAFYHAVTPSNWHRKKRLDGKVVLITGASGGIGSELARQIAAKRTRLILWDRNVDGLEAVAEQCRQLGAEVSTHTVDLSERDSIYAAARDMLIACTDGHVDVIIHSAGLTNKANLLDIADANVQRLIDVNLMALIWITKAFLPSMIEHGSGHLVAMSSMASMIAIPGLADYTASKFAVNGFMECVHNEALANGHNGLRFTTVCPMFVNTPLIQKMEVQDHFLPILKVDDLARQVVDAIECERQFLAVPRRAYVFIALKGILPRNLIQYLVLRQYCPYS